MSLPIMSATAGERTLDFRGAMPAGLTFSRASTGWATNAAGLLVEYAASVPRIDYNPATLTPLGLLREGQSTNLITYSQALLNNPPWTPLGSATLADNQATAPDGNNTAALVTKTIAAGSTGTYYVFGIPCTASTTHTASFWVKLGTALAGDLRYSLYDETGAAFIALEVAYAQTATAGAWTRLSVTFTTPVGCVSLRWYPWRYLNAALNASIYVWGHQVEALAFASSYIKTAGATATRAADACSLAAFPGFVGTGGVSMAAQFDLLNNAANTALFGFAGAGGFSDTLYANQVGTGLGFVSIISTVNANTSSATVGAIGAVQKAAFAISPSILSGALNGVLLTPTGHTGIPPAVTITPTAAPWDVAGAVPFMHIRRLQMWPRRLSDIELQQVTT
jgi:hypothetical protein